MSVKQEYDHQYWEDRKHVWEYREQLLRTIRISLLSGSTPELRERASKIEHALEDVLALCP